MNNVYDYHIPPNFLNSILTNDTLYNMFRNDFDNNINYFKDIDKEIYITELDKYICMRLSSADVSYLNYFRRFYDDFILPKIQNCSEYIFNTELFKTLKTLYKINNKLITNDSFLSFYKYIFSSSNYFDKSDEIINNIKSQIEIGVVDYQILTNYIKNTCLEYIPIDICCIMLKNHIYRTNHIFDSEVVKKIVLSIANDFLRKYNIIVNIEYIDVILSKNVRTHDIETFTIYLDSILIDTFISGNYVELLSSLFYKLTLFKDNYLTRNNVLCLDTLRAIWRFVNCKVEVDKIFIDPKYKPYEYYSEMETNAFIMTLRFLNIIDINLFDNYLNSQIRDLEMSHVIPKNSPKEIPEEMKFINRFSKMEKGKIQFLRNKYKVLQYFYGTDGRRYKVIELLNKFDNDYKNEIFEYISLIIPEPIYLIEDVTDTVNQTFNDEEIGNFVLKMIKYIYPDIFYYSLKAYLIMSEDKISFNKSDYLDELYVRISSIKEIEETQRFLKSALNTIELMKQNC